MKPSRLNQHKAAIQATLLWFSLRGRSLSVEEISQLLYQDELSPAEIEVILPSLKRVKKDRFGRYSLLLDQTKHLSKSGYQTKWAVANRAARLLRWIPNIQLVGVVNSLADQTSHPDSDIDFFIVTKVNRLFTTRLLITLILSLFNLRRREKDIKNKVCLSFFVTEDNLDLEPIAITNEDVYLAYWVAQLIPVINHDNSYQEFLKANHWVASIVPKYSLQEYPDNSRLFWASLWELLGNNFFGNLTEKYLRNWQLKRIANHPKPKDKDVLVVANEKMLKFHGLDRRRTYRERWRKLFNLLSN